ncbi:MAG: hypothetical protein JW913_02530 [Chitinispirillaceae bacterium]|nr:hypothetical protein [Chitinispirillaceae bacterium]
MNQRYGVFRGAMRIVCIAGALLAWHTPVAADTVTVDITRSGRKIMHDGFLMEWGMQTARTWGRDSTWLWDATVTPEGMAGYMRTQSAPPCSGWVIGFSGPSLNQPCEVRLPSDSTWQSDFLKIDHAGYDSSGAYTLEWLFPWPQHRMENHTSFFLTIKGRCLSGDTLPVMVLVSSSQEKKTPDRGSLIVRAVLIGILAMMYLMIRRKIKHQTPQMGSPRQ